MDFTDHDRMQMQEARKLLIKVYEAHRDSHEMSRKLGRMETILGKLDQLLTVPDNVE